MGGMYLTCASVASAWYGPAAEAAPAAGTMAPAPSPIAQIIVNFNVANLALVISFLLLRVARRAM